MTAATTVSAAFLSTAPDIVPPSVAITAPIQAPAYMTNASTLTLAGTSADNVAVAQVSWANDRGGNGIASGTTSWSAPGIALQSGVNTLTVTARDTSGNIGTATLIVTYDPTAPTVSIVAPTSGAIVSGTVNFAAVAADNIGVAGVQLFLDGRALGSEQLSPLSVPWDTTAVPNGVHALSARARDAAGNTATVVLSVTVSNPLPTDLVAAFGFNEGGGTIAADSSGNNNTATLVGATWTTAGQFGSALVFNGGSAYADLGNGPTVQLTGSMTISAWIRPTAFPRDDAAIVSKRTIGNLGYQIDTTVDTGPRTIGFKLTNAAGGKMFRYGATALQLNQWYYVTGVYDAAAATINVYLNGQLDNGSLIGPVTTTQQNSPLNVNIGRRASSTGYNFTGIIDEVRLYRRPLSAAEIRRDMATAVGGSSSDVTAPSIAITAPTSAPSYTASGASVTLAGTATDDTGVTQVSWTSDRGGSGSASGTTNWTVAGIPLQPGVNVLTVSARDAAGNTAITAVSVLLPTVTLSVSKAGNGAGDVTSAPVGIDCGPTCTHAYPSGTRVILNALPTGGSTFAGWSGGGCSGVSSCSVPLAVSTQVTATFVLPATSVSIDAPAAVTFNSNPSVTVNVSSAGGPPTGVVSLILDGGIPQNATLVGGHAVFVLNKPSVGNHALTARYAAQAGFGASTATAPLHVNGPGLYFSSNTFSATAGSSEVTISVVRSGRLSATVTVSYATSDGTTVAGIDYIPVSGTLMFGPATTVQSFVIKLRQTGQTTPRTVNLILSDPSSSMSLGWPSTAVLVLGAPVVSASP
jgi:hypothetical protein